MDVVNRLKDSTSPYLLQHADNPVDWWPWSEEAFAEAARREAGGWVAFRVSRQVGWPGSPG